MKDNSNKDQPVIAGIINVLTGEIFETITSFDESDSLTIALNLKAKKDKR